MTVGNYIAVVFFQAAGKTMMSVAIRYKIEELGLCGVERCFQRALAGVANRPWREP